MKFFNILALIFLSTLNAAEISGKRNSRIIGGDLAIEGQFPYQVSLQYKGSHICGGGIIDDQYILTAAHCIIMSNGKFSPYKLTAVMNTIDLQNPGNRTISRSTKILYVLKEFRPQDYVANTGFTTTADIAVLKLDHPIGLSNNTHLKKLNLPPNDNSDYANETATIAGHGYNRIEIKEDPNTGIKYEDGDSDDKLRFAKAKVLTNDECQIIRPATVYKSHICAAVKQRNSSRYEGVCSGDSGSPLVVQGDIVIGVVNNSPPGCNEAGLASIYTRVSSFLNFIDNARNDVMDKLMRRKTWK